jgi:alpha-L-arabinofuranosidase
VTRGDETLLAADFTAGAGGWSADPKWAVQDGAFRQADPRATTSAYAGEPSWKDYTLSLKARKLSGSEGFLMTVRGNGPEDYVVWNLGGWGNKFHGLLSHLGQQDRLFARVPGSIETGRWYDIKVVLHAARVDCFLDGNLLQSADIPARRTLAFFASASQVEPSGDIIIKVVNPTGDPAETVLQLRGLPALSPTAQATVLTSATPADENSFETPEKVAPMIEVVSGVKPEFTYTFKPYSLTVLRLGAERK